MGHLSQRVATRRQSSSRAKLSVILWRLRYRASSWGLGALLCLREGMHGVKTLSSRGSGYQSHHIHDPSACVRREEGCSAVPARRCNRSAGRPCSASTNASQRSSPAGRPHWACRGTPGRRVPAWASVCRSSSMDRPCRPSVSGDMTHAARRASMHPDRGKAGNTTCCVVSWMQNECLSEAVTSAAPRQPSRNLKIMRRPV